MYELTPNKRHLELTIEHASTLALAWFFTGNAKYARRARDKVYTWFLDPNISMYPDLRVAGVHRGGTKFGRPEGISDMARLPDLLNAAVMLEGAADIWSAEDTRLLRSWVFQYINFLTTEPVAVYARMMGNYIGTNVDEQLLAAHLYLSEVQAESRTEAEKIAFYSRVRSGWLVIAPYVRHVGTPGHSVFAACPRTARPLRKLGLCRLGESPSDWRPGDWSACGAWCCRS